MLKRKHISTPSWELPLPVFPAPEQKRYSALSRWGLLGAEFALLVTIASFFCVYRIGDFSFGFGDQSTHSLVVQHMVHSGNWWSPEREGNFYANKPPFKMWLVAIIVKLFGESNFTYRVLDGLCGVAMALLVYYSGLFIFHSRLVGVFSVLTLLGSRTFYYGHGVRNATQDAMLLLLCTVALLLGYSFINRVIDPSPRDRTQKRSLVLLTLGIGISVGCAVLTKNLIGYIVFALLGIYLILLGKTWQVFRSAWKNIVAGSLLSITIPALFFVPHCLYTPGACEGYFVSEVWKRATRGYHNVHDRYYYWKWLIEDRTFVPPELLLVAALFSLALIFRRRDNRHLFLLVWGLGPIVLLSLLRSKIFWYVLPALPALSMIIGITLKEATTWSWNVFRDSIVLGEVTRKIVVFPVLFLLFALGVLSKQLYDIGGTILQVRPRTVLDELAHIATKTLSSSSSQKPILTYQTPRPSRDEVLYLNMISTRDVSLETPENLKSIAFSHDYLLAPLGELELVFRLRPVVGYAILEPRHRRSLWEILVAYENNFPPHLFQSVTRSLDFGDPNLPLLFGRDHDGYAFNRTVMISRGPKAGLTVSCDLACSLLGTDVEIVAASLLPSGRGPLALTAYLNDSKIGDSQEIRAGFQSYRFQVPPHVWQVPENVLTLSLSLPENDSIGRNEKLVLYDKLTITLRQ